MVRRVVTPETALTGSESSIENKENVKEGMLNEHLKQNINGFDVLPRSFRHFSTSNQQDWLKNILGNELGNEKLAK